MSDARKTKKELLAELAELRQGVARLEAAEAVRLEVENALRESEERYRTLFEQATDAIFVEDASQRIVDVNHRACELTGYTREELLALKTEDLQPKEVQGPSMITTGRFETLVIHREGSTVPVEITVAPVTGQEGVYMSIVRDMTDRKQAELDRERLIVELDAFAHTVAHNLKNPVSMMLISTELLKDGPENLTAEEVQVVMDTISRSGHRMYRIIDELLLMASMRALDTALVEPLEMGTVVAETLERLHYVIEQHDAQITMPEVWPMALGHAPWVEEVWANYLSNAIKYGGNPPVVELGASVEAVDGAPVVRFWVRDDGSGISPEGQATLFEPFTRLDQITVEGHGLGLSIVQRIVENLGGQVDVQSREGEGSVFSFTLPAAAPSTSEEPPAGA